MKRDTLPVSAALLVALTCAVLFFILGRVVWFLPVFVVLVAASYTIPVRIPVGLLTNLIPMALVGFLGFLSTPNESPEQTLLIGGFRGNAFLGQLWMLSATLQFWRSPVVEHKLRSLLAILFSLFGLMVACNSYDPRAMQFLVPGVVVLALVALRTYRGTRRGTRSIHVLFVLSLVGALLVGRGSVALVQVYRGQIIDWGNRVLPERQLLENSRMVQPPMLGPMFGMRGSNQRVLRLEGKLLDPHLRGVAYANYIRGRWGPAIRERSLGQAKLSELSVSTPNRELGTTVQVSRLAAENPLVYAPLSASTIDLGDLTSIESALDEDGPIFIGVTGLPEYSYRGISEKFSGVLGRPKLKTAASTLRYLAISPELRDQLMPLAQSITARAKTPAAKAKAVETYLLENYTYALTFNPGDGDPVANFLLASPKRPAHCEFFAASAVMLLRCVGVPTRYVVGYYAHEDEDPKHVIVRQRDAHAWCEAWIDGVGWQVVEATPPSGMPESTPIPTWNRLIERLQDLWMRLRSGLENGDPTVILTIAAVPLILTIGLFVLRFVQQRKQASGIDPNLWLAPPVELGAFVLRFERVLRQAGAGVEPTQPWSEVVPSLPLVFQQPARTFLQHYEALRFGGRGDKNDLELALTTLERLRVSDSERRGSTG